MTPWVRRLIVANVLMFFVQQTASPALLQLLVFKPAFLLLRPWTVVTYMFLHGGLGHIFFNMLGLFFFGPRVEERLGSNRFITLYFISGATGALVSYLFANDAAVIGASGGLFGVMLAFAHFWPRDLIYIWGVLPVEAWLLVAIMTAMSLFSGYSGSGGGIAHFAHLGGFAGAFLYLRWVGRAAGTKRFRSRTTPGVADKILGNWRNVDARSVHEVNRDEVNRILDKIGKSGLGSLTPQERVFLSNFVPPDDRVPPPS